MWLESVIYRGAGLLGTAWADRGCAFAIVIRVVGGNGLTVLTGLKVGGASAFA